VKNIWEFNLDQAALAYAVANTPLFLLRKLREDPLTREISSSFSGDTLFTELQNALKHRPESLQDYVRPYVYLVALSMKQEDRWLRDAVRIPSVESWNWFRYLQHVLLETYVPTETGTINIPPSVCQIGVTVRGDGPVVRQVVNLR
jgi:hypothetical protein